MPYIPEDMEDGIGIKAFLVVAMEYDLHRTPLAAFATRDEAVAMIRRIVDEVDERDLSDTYYIYHLGEPFGPFGAIDEAVWSQVASGRLVKGGSWL